MRVINLPKYENKGQEIAYSWTLDSVPTGYELTSTRTVNAVTTITYTRVIDVSVKAVWSDSSNQYSKRPESLKVTLSNGTEVTLNSSNGWQATVQNLPKYENNQTITYTWKVTIPKAYKLTKSEKSGNTTTMTITLQVYTITYNPNGGTWSDGSKTSIKETYPVTDAAKIRKAPTRDGYTFVQWKGSSYQPGDTYKEKDSSGNYISDTLVAQWQATSDDNSSSGPGGSSPSDGKSVKTGDESDIGYWSAVVFCSAAAMACCFFLLSKEQRKKNKKV